MRKIIEKILDSLNQLLIQSECQIKDGIYKGRPLAAMSDKSTGIIMDTANNRPHFHLYPFGHPSNECFDDALFISLHKPFYNRTPMTMDKVFSEAERLHNICGTHNYYIITDRWDHYYHHIKYKNIINNILNKNGRFHLYFVGGSTNPFILDFI